MSNKKVWFITGAERSMGLDITKAALVTCRVPSRMRKHRATRAKADIISPN